LLAGFEVSERVVRGVLVRVRPRGEVERRVDEIVDRRARVEHRVRNVDQLGCLFAENVGSEQTPV
jgi:hypothetical protein